MSSNAIRPTWAPFSSTLSAEERLVFSLRLMNGKWEAIPTCGWGFCTLFPVQGSSGTQHPAGEANLPHGKHQHSCFWAEPRLWSHGSSGTAGATPSLSPWRCLAEDWSAERPFTGFQLGDVLNIQAEVGTESHVPLRLFVDSCVAALSPGTDSSPHYAIIDFNG